MTSAKVGGTSYDDDDVDDDGEDDDVDYDDNVDDDDDADSIMIIVTRGVEYHIIQYYVVCHSYRVGVERPRGISVQSEEHHRRQGGRVSG